MFHLKKKRKKRIGSGVVIAITSMTGYGYHTRKRDFESQWDYFPPGKIKVKIYI